MKTLRTVGKYIDTLSACINMYVMSTCGTSSCEGDSDEERADGILSQSLGVPLQDHLRYNVHVYTWHMTCMHIHLYTFEQFVI